MAGNSDIPITTGMNTLAKHISGLVENLLKQLVISTARYNRFPKQAPHITA